MNFQAYQEFAGRPPLGEVVLLIDPADAHDEYVTKRREVYEQRGAPVVLGVRCPQCAKPGRDNKPAIVRPDVRLTNCRACQGEGWKPYRETKPND